MGAGGSGGNGFVSSYIGLYNALDAIIGKQIGQYTSFQNTSTGDLNGDLAWSFGGTPIIFNGNAQDVLSSSAYNTLKNIIEQAYDPNANTNTGVDPNLVAGLINQVFNSAIENTIDTATDVARGLVFGKEGAPAGTQTISTYADAYELATTQSGDALNVEANLTALNERYSLASRREPYGDYNDNNSIDSNDLISFLADFGTEPSAPLNVISAPSSDTAIRNLIDQRKYKTFDVQYELSNPLGPVPTTTETDDFTNNLTAAINNLLGDALNGTVAFLNGEFIVIPN